MGISHYHNKLELRVIPSYSNNHLEFNIVSHMRFSGTSELCNMQMCTGFSLLSMYYLVS